jgi:DNA-binding NtrC family response regulator
MNPLVPDFPEESRIPGPILTVYLEFRRTAVGNILVTDDDRACRESIQKVLEQQGHWVRAAEDVDTALQVLGAQHFDLVVCDYRMPGKTGVDFLVEMKRCGCVVPVLIVSACADAQTQAAILELGAFGFLKKPVRKQDLLNQAARAIDG